MRQNREKKTDYIGIAIEPEFRRTIERQAQREHRSMSCFIRAVLAERVATAHEAGAAG